MDDRVKTEPEVCEHGAETTRYTWRCMLPPHAGNRHWLQRLHRKVDS